MRKMIIRSASMLGILLVLFTALVTLIRFYPYTYNFPAYPKLTHTQSGAKGDPLNLVFVGSKDQITHSFHQAGWLIPDSITPHTSAKIAAESLAHRSYPTAPVSHLYVFGRVQDLAFEKPTNDVQNRGHVRIWKTRVFLFYDTLFTVVGALIAFLVLLAVLIAGLLLWRFTERNRTIVRTEANGMGRNETLGGLSRK